jgi:monofunctional biosynthetic peptidoglycan transglycosylase
MRRVLIGVLLLAILVCAFQVLVITVSAGLPEVGALARHAPKQTSLMKARAAEAAQNGRRYQVDQRWVPYGNISPYLRRAVLIAEDDAFFAHGGLDWNEIRASARANIGEGRVVRGGSTITQQLAKNLWLGSSRTPWRKFEEMLLAVRLERDLTKRRILELYLNTIEWGDGIYGIDAAAHYWFGVGASALDANQSIRLAAIIINPRVFSPVTPNERITNRIRTIAERLRRRGAISEEQYRVTLGLPPEALAPAVDSTLIARPDTTTSPPAEPEPPPPAADSAAVETLAIVR